MTTEEIRNEILNILEVIAPDEDLTNIDDSVNFRDQMELDSMDFLDIVPPHPDPRRRLHGTGQHELNGEVP